MCFFFFHINDKSYDKYIISETYHSCERKKYKFIIFWKYWIITYLKKKIVWTHKFNMINFEGSSTNLVLDVFSNVH